MNNFEDYLLHSLDCFDDSVIKQAMLYCLDGGKRFRQQIMFAIVKGFDLDESIAYPSACALEYIQTYSLIHDDLPGMDNDDYRRGKLSCHKKFKEDIAILTGDAFLNHSFSCISNSNYSDEVKVKLICELTKYAGLFGMIKGQLLDVTADSKLDERKLFDIQDNKTSGLFKYACISAMILANNDDYQYFEKLGSKLGIVFQNQDDLFDVIKSEKETGKSNSDIRNDKLTALSYKSVDELKDSIKTMFIDLKEYLNSAPFNNKYLLQIIEKMENR